MSSRKDLEKVPYYIGLDCGTNSVGFAVTDTDYNLLKFRGNQMWGAHLFEEGATAEERRIARNARKRLARRRERLNLLQDIFAEEIAKRDPTFFIRLNESYLHVEDRTEEQKNSLFNDILFSDKEYMKKYPTVFHLRKAFMDGEEITDPRLLYLALHHILKNRGHFLYPGEDFSSVGRIDSLIKEFEETFEAVYDDASISISSCDEFENALKISDKSERIEKLKLLITSNNDKVRDLAIKALVGYKVKADKLFDNEEYKELNAIEFKKQDFDETVMPELEQSLTDDEYHFIECLKAIHDRALLIKVLSGYTSISEAKVALWDQNKKDLVALKSAIKKYCTSEEYEEFFHSDNKEGGFFSNYIGAIHNNGEKKAVRRCSSVDDFYKAIKKLLDPYKEEEDVKKIFESIENDSFLNLLISFRNSVVPWQLNKAEMNRILENASRFFPFLKIKGDDGLSPMEKIPMLLKFRIPYYVGPLGGKENNKNFWLVRKNAGKIYPWNFDEMVDEEESATCFIKRMTNKCTYLIGEDVIPKNSLLYQSYMVLNEINKLKINGEKIEVALKQDMYKELYMKNSSVTPKKIKEYIKTKAVVGKDEKVTLSGMDTDEEYRTKWSSLSSYAKFRKFIESGKLKKSDVEKIIGILTVFSDGGKMARRYIEREFGDKLDDKEIGEISSWKFSGWGRFSKKFLVGGPEFETFDPETGAIKSIIDILWETNENLMEIINDNKYDFAKILKGEDRSVSSISHSVLDEMRLSPAVKKQIWQTLKIVKDIRKVMGHNPEKVFIEVARENDPKKKGKRTKSRREQLLESLKKDKSGEVKEILDQIENDPRLSETSVSRKDKYYLYLTQRGKDMYTGKPINLDEIGSGGAYDIDHIYAYSLSGDDSLDNKVLVNKKDNIRKGKDLVPPDIQEKMIKDWTRLKELDLISSEKFKRLTRKGSLDEDDMKKFIARQLVEVRQNTIATADLLKRFFGENTRIVYSKATEVTKFRNYEDKNRGIKFDFPKSRSINHLHHAKDAYLNIVVGNVLDTKYTDNFFLKWRGDNPYGNLGKPFSSNVEGAWNLDVSQKTVVNTMSGNRILFTRNLEAKSGAIFDLQLLKAGEKQGMIPAKTVPALRRKLEASGNKDEVIDEWVSRYGGYNSIKISYLSLIEDYDKKGKRYVVFIPIPIMLSSSIHTDEDILDYGRRKYKVSPNAHVLKAKVLFKTPIFTKGMKMRITGTSSNGTMLTLSSDIPLLLESESVHYVKTIEGFFDKKKNNKALEISSWGDRITAEQNVSLYEILLKKCNLQILANRPRSQWEKVFLNSREKFASLSLEDQCFTILEVIKYLGMDNGQADLRKLGGSENAGKLVCGSKFEEGDSLSIINESHSGLFSWEEVIIE